MRCIKMTIPRTWLYKGKECTIRDLGCIKECSADIFRKLLKEVEPGTEIDSIVDSYKIRSVPKYCYRGTLCTITELVKMSGLSRMIVYRALKKYKEFSVIDTLIDELEAPWYAIYEGERVSKKELAKLIGVSDETLRHKLEGIPSGTDVTNIDPSTKIRRFVYNGKTCTVSDLSNLLGVEKSRISIWLKGVYAGVDVTDLINEHKVNKKWMYHGELCTMNRIANLCGRSRNFVANALVNAKENECVDDLIDIDISTKWANIDWHGTKKSIIELSTDYGISLSNLYYECNTHGTKKLKEYIDSYGGDRRLELREAARPYCDWICDNLWVCKNPETGEETVLATEDINKLEVSECRK